MARTTKKQLIEKFNKLFDECVELYNGKLRELLDAHKITTGHYYYVLSPYNEYHASLFYGFDNQKAMISHKDSYTVWHFKYHLEKLQEHKQKMLKVIEEIA